MVIVKAPAAVSVDELFKAPEGVSHPAYQLRLERTPATLKELISRIPASPLTDPVLILVG